MSKLQQLIELRDMYTKDINNPDITENFITYYREEAENCDAKIKEILSLSKLGQLMYEGYIDHRDATQKCRVLYPLGFKAKNSDEELARVWVIDSNGLDDMKTMPKSKVDQYLLDRGFDPNGEWS